MSEPESAPIRRLVVPATCATHPGPVGFTNLLLRKVDDLVELDPHATGACVLVLDEAAATAMRDTLSEWLG